MTVSISLEEYKSLIEIKALYNNMERKLNKTDDREILYASEVADLLGIERPATITSADLKEIKIR